METPRLSVSERAAAASAYQKALEMLSRRDHCREELRRKLAAKGFAGQDLDTALERLASQGFIDDAKFAARWVETALRNGRGYGLRLSAELRTKGVGRDIAESAVTAAAVDTPETEALAALVSKKFTAFDNNTATTKEKQRVYAYLQRRGFTLSAIISYFRNNGTESNR